jgi:multiple sugar transport system permease protein
MTMRCDVQATEDTEGTERRLITASSVGAVSSLATSMRRLSYHLVASTIAALFVVPLLWATLASLRMPGLPPPQGLSWLADPLTLGNYRRIFDLLPLGSYLLNSIIVACVSVLLTLIIASWAGFAMARLPGPVRGRLVILAVLLRLVPLPILWLARFILFSRLQINDTLWALIAPAWMGTSPFYVLLFYWAFRRVPGDLFDAARLEGASVLQSWALVAMPMVRPTAASVVVLSFMHYWSDFINPLIYLKSERNYTLAVGLRTLQQLDLTNWPLLMAGAVVMMLPMLLLFLLAQRAFWVAGGVGSRQ